MYWKNLLCLLAALVSALGEKDYNLRSVFECGRKYNVSIPQVAASLQRLELPTSENGKCFLQCMMEKQGMLLWDGSVNVPFAKQLTSESDSKTKNHEIIDTCVKQATPHKGKCEYSFQYMQCTINRAKQDFVLPRTDAVLDTDYCSQKYSMSASVVAAGIRRLQLPNSQNGKCVLHCLMDQQGLLQKDGTLNITFAKGISINSQNRSLFHQVIDICVNEAAPYKGSCDYSWRYLECAINHEREMGLLHPVKEEEDF